MYAKYEVFDISKIEKKGVWLLAAAHCVKSPIFVRKIDFDKVHFQFLIFAKLNLPN